MASSIKVVLRKKANKEGKFPLAIRVTVNRKSSFTFLGINLYEDEWDEATQQVKPKKKPGKGSFYQETLARMNNSIIQKKAEITNKLPEIGGHQKDVSSKAILKQVKSKAGNSFLHRQIHLLKACVNRESIIVRVRRNLALIGFAHS
ncbi:Arm DNA-binding domain-containing protein [Runella sp.]|uniref:Arm DNA-binding domain-containing protein n=1 Tax=Runella sp. TaxID=1960881 RepID=UPI003D0F36C6